MIYLAEIISLIEIGYVDETNVMTDRDEPGRAGSFSNGAKLREINAIDRRKKKKKNSPRKITRVVDFNWLFLSQWKKHTCGERT